MQSAALVTRPRLYASVVSMSRPMVASESMDLKICVAAQVHLVVMHVADRWFASRACTSHTGQQRYMAKRTPATAMPEGRQGRLP